MSARHRRRGVAAIALATAAIGGLGPGVAAAPSQERPTATATPTDLRVGTEVTISGTGCIDPVTSASGSLGVVLQRPGDAPGTGIPLASGVAADADGSFAVQVTIGDPLPTGPLDIGVGCFAGDPPTPETVIEIYPLIPVSAQSPPVTGLEVDRTTLSFDDPCTGITGSMGVSNLATLTGPGGEVVVFDAVEAVDGRVSYPIPELEADGEWTVVAECYRRRVDLPAVIRTGSFVLGATVAPPGGPTPAGPATTEAAPAAPVAGDADYTG